MLYLYIIIKNQKTKAMKFNYNDGGRIRAGFKGKTRDCVTRSIAIATQRPYIDVYDALNFLSKDERVSQGAKGAKRSSSRTGVHRKTYEKYLLALGWKWQPTMLIGKGCQVHLTDGELPPGRLIVRLSKHLTAVINGEIHDVFDPQREERRCVYGYFYKP